MFGKLHPPLVDVVHVACDPQSRLRCPICSHLPNLLRKHTIEAQMCWCPGFLITKHAKVVVRPFAYSSWKHQTSDGKDVKSKEKLRINEYKYVRVPTNLPSRLMPSPLGAQPFAQAPAVVNGHRRSCVNPRSALFEFLILQTTWHFKDIQPCG